MGALPFFLPGMVLWAALVILGSPFVSRALRTSRLHAALLLMALGLVFMATLPPTGAALAGASSYQDFCDFERTSVAPLSVLLRPNEVSLNVALFVPLGLAIGSLPWSLRAFIVAAAALILPIAVELYQLSFPSFGRGCQSADVIDNTMGLVIGLAVGLLGRALLARSPRA